jgi:hypothetical protein
LIEEIDRSPDSTAVLNEEDGVEADSRLRINSTSTDAL